MYQEAGQQAGPGGSTAEAPNDDDVVEAEIVDEGEEGKSA
jgi:hypothetical protein